MMPGFPMKRRLFNLLMALSLVLFAASPALWVRSRVLRHQDEVSWDGRRSAGSLISAGGELFFHHVTWDRRWWHGAPLLSYSHEAPVLGFTPAPPPRWLGPGLGFLRRHGVSRSAGSSLGIG